MPELTHVDANGEARMVEVGEKPITARSATAEGWITLSPDALAAVVATQERVQQGALPRIELTQDATEEERVEYRDRLAQRRGVRLRRIHPHERVLQLLECTPLSRPKRLLCGCEEHG